MLSGRGMNMTSRIGKEATAKLEEWYPFKAQNSYQNASYVPQVSKG